MCAGAGLELVMQLVGIAAGVMIYLAPFLPIWPA